MEEEEFVLFLKTFPKSLERDGRIFDCANRVWPLFDTSNRDHHQIYQKLLTALEEFKCQFMDNVRLESVFGFETSKGIFGYIIEKRFWFSDAEAAPENVVASYRYEFLRLDDRHVQNGLELYMYYFQILEPQTIEETCDNFEKIQDAFFAGFFIPHDLFRSDIMNHCSLRTTGANLILVNVGVDKKIIDGN
jgi:hypothetical protein